MNEKYRNPQAARVIAYEFKMFQYLYEKLRLDCQESGAFIPGEIVLCGTGHCTEAERDDSARLEAFLLHTRVLREFFYYRFKADGKKWHDDDLIAEDFLSNWAEDRPPMGKYLCKHKTRLDKGLAHLTTTRVEHNQTEKRWEISTIHQKMKPVIELFRQMLAPEIKSWFAETE